MVIGQWPTDHAGLTADDIPYGYSSYGSIFDDGRGYDPKVIGYEIDDAGHTVILVATSPGAVVPLTMVTPGQDPEAAAEAVLETLKALRATAPALPAEPGEARQGPPGAGHSHREATQ